MRMRVGMGGTYSTRVQRGGRFYCFSILLLTVFLAACAGPQPTTAITATSTAETAELIFPPTPTPRASPPTLAPTATLVPQPTLEPTLTPEPTETPTPEPTETPDPAVVESQRVAEYVEANTEPINRVEMPLLEFRASDQLQEAIWDRLPDDVQALGDKPLYMMVYDVEKLTEVIGNLSIHVAGHEDKVPLADKKVVFTFLSGREEIPEVFLPYYVANQSDGYRYGAFEGGDGEIHVVIELASSISFTYKYDSFHEWQIMSEGVVLGLNQLSGNQDRDVVRFGKRFYIDTPYDDFSHPEDTRGITWLMHPSVGYGLRHELNSGYLSPGYYKMMGEWIPEEYRGQIPGLEQ